MWMASSGLGLSRDIVQHGRLMSLLMQFLIQMGVQSVMYVEPRDPQYGGIGRQGDKLTLLSSGYDNLQKLQHKYC